MQLLSGVNHVAIVTQDIDRFIDFYSRMFGADIVFQESTPFKHAILRTGPASWLHPVELPDNPNSAAGAGMFERGHLDHIALGAASAQAFEIIRKRLVDNGSSDGAVENLGAFRAVWFEDPDGMRGELTLIVDPALQGIHEPRPYGAADRV